MYHGSESSTRKESYRQGQYSVIREFFFISNSIPRGPGGASRQAAALRREGVIVSTGHLGELTIDLGMFGWYPSTLPSEEAETSTSEEEESS